MEVSVIRYKKRDKVSEYLSERTGETYIREILRAWINKGSVTVSNWLIINIVDFGIWTERLSVMA